jgi:hypothetical protein
MEETFHLCVVGAGQNPELTACVGEGQYSHRLVKMKHATTLKKRVGS